MASSLNVISIIFEYQKFTGWIKSRPQTTETHPLPINRKHKVTSTKSNSKSSIIYFYFGSIKPQEKVINKEQSNNKNHLDNL